MTVPQDGDKMVASWVASAAVAAEREAVPAQLELAATVNVTLQVPAGTTLNGNSIVLPSGEVLRVRPAFELCDDEQGEYLDLTYDQLTARGVYYEIQRVEVEPDL